MAGLPPQIPPEFQIYNSYVEDPKWQTRFTIVWCSALGVVIASSLPIVIRSVKNGSALKGFFGVSEDIQKSGYTIVPCQHRFPPHSRPEVTRLWRSIGLIRYWTLPWVGLNISQLVTVLVYLGTLLYCIIKDAPLVSNPNRAGFLALAQFPVVFLFATKNSILSFLLGPGNGYERLNFLHRTAGRFMFLSAAIHGSLWIRNHFQYGLPILGPQKETSGVAALSVLITIVLTSLRPVRRLFYHAFFVIHVLTFVAFFIVVNYHTRFARPWIIPPLAFFATDIFFRFLRSRIKDAKLVAPNGFFTMMQINHCDDGWLAGQHIRLRVFFSNRMFESHPFTIMSAPPAQSCLDTSGMLLAASVNGDWTRALNDFTQKEQDRLNLSKKVLDYDGVPVYVAIDGPYGGCSVDLGQYEAALLVSGGSGVTFTLALLDDIVSRCVKRGRRGGELTRRIEFVWYIKCFDQIAWFDTMLSRIGCIAMSQGSTVDLRTSIYITCPCDVDTPVISCCDVQTGRPSLRSLLYRVAGFPLSMQNIEGKSDMLEGQSQGQVHAGGVAVCASGPESMMAEVQNVVARLRGGRVRKLGDIALHVEKFSL